MANIYVWIAQGFLALLFGYAGGFKAFGDESDVITKIDCFAKGKLWAGWHRFVGRAELLGAIGVILPTATGILPVLTPLAALGFALIMVIALTTVNGPAKKTVGIVADIILFTASVVVINGYWDLLRPYLA